MVDRPTIYSIMYTYCENTPITTYSILNITYGFLSGAAFVALILTIYSHT